MSELRTIPNPLPAAAAPALEIVRRLSTAGHEALLAGGCVRDMLLGATPSDFDVATDAPPERVAALFRPTRQVGAQFGVVLVRMFSRWVEVATFRIDAEYRDGRRPESVAFSTAREDARRRDFTVNGMFFDPFGGRIIDYVGGQEDLRGGVIRAIGDPAARFAEDHLRLIRAVRFAARLGFEIEPLTAAAIRMEAGKLARVSAERVREELEKMLSAPTRAAALRGLRDHDLARFLWGGPALSDLDIERALELLQRLPPDAPFELAFAVLIASQSRPNVDAICRNLTCSNEQREAIIWLVANQVALDDPAAPTLAALKRLMASRWFTALHMFADARAADYANAEERRITLRNRCAAIAPEAVAPPPLVTGDDLLLRGIARGPIYAHVLNELYTRQLDETLRTRDEALRALSELLASNSLDQNPARSGGA